MHGSRIIRHVTGSFESRGGSFHPVRCEAANAEISEAKRIKIRREGRETMLTVPSKLATLSNQTTHQCHRRSPIRKLTCIAVLFFACVALVPHATYASGPDYSIEVGEASVVPGQVELLLPVIVSSPQELQAWSTGLQYDNNHLQLIGVVLEDTASEGLDPTVELSPMLPPFNGVRLEYPADSPLPAGAEMTVAYLRFAIVPGAFPSGSGSFTTVVILGSPAAESFPHEFELQSGAIVNPPLTGADLTFYYGNILQVIDSTGSYYESVFTAGAPIVVELRIWSLDAGSSIRFRLRATDLIDEFLIAYDLDETILESIGGVTVDVTTIGDDLEIVIEAPLIPAAVGEPLIFLELTPVSPIQGELRLSFDPDNCEIDGDPIDNLLNGDFVLQDAFMRGDVNFDGEFNVGDVVELLLYMHGTLTELVCEDAADIDDDDEVAINDAVLALSSLFLTGAPLPPPFEVPGVDPSADDPGDAISCLPAL